MRERTDGARMQSALKLRSKDENTILEREPLENLAVNNQLKAYLHTGFWHCMDTIRDKESLNQIWSKGDAPWK